MNMRSAVACASLAFSVSAMATSWNLSADWSSMTNPFGIWSLHKNPTDLFTQYVTNWVGSGHGAWAGSNNGVDHVPAWFKAIQDNDLGVDVYDGAIFMHTAETPRTGTEISVARWTSQMTGTVYIKGGIWMARKVGRLQNWFIRKNSIDITGGLIDPAVQYTSQNPIDYSTGSGGSSALVMSVVPGDTIEISPRRIPNASPGTGDLVGLEFAITTSPTQGYLQGNVDFQNFEGDVSLHQPVLLLKRADGETVFKKRLTLDADGNYSTPICMNGSFRASIQFSHWLKQAKDASVNDDGAEVNFSLINGDIDQDNEINLVDFGRLSTAFGSAQGHPNWNPDADLDGDAEVTLVDYSVIAANFGLMGDN